MIYDEKRTMKRGHENTGLESSSFSVKLLINGNPIDHPTGHHPDVVIGG